MALSAVATAPASAASEPQRVTVTGEVIDSWCYLSEIMWAEGSAHHRCAVWCARGGVPVGILGEDEEVYIVLMMENDPNVIGNKAVFRIQTKEVVVTGDSLRARQRQVSRRQRDRRRPRDCELLPRRLRHPAGRALIMRANRTLVRLAAALAVAGSMAVSGIAAAANSWGLPDEVEARFDAKVTDVLCVLSGDCPEDCGAGNRLLGLLQDDGTLVLPLKNAGPFTGPDGRSHPLL